MNGEARQEDQARKDAKYEEDGKESPERKRKKVIDSENGHEEKFVVGMRAETIADGVFGNPLEVGKFIEKQVGRVDSVRITRSGVVIIVCGDVKQLNKALKIIKFGEVPVRTFRIGEGARRMKGVILSLIHI